MKEKIDIENTIWVVDYRSGKKVVYCLKAEVWDALRTIRSFEGLDSIMIEKYLAIMDENIRQKGESHGRKKSEKENHSKKEN